jgi:hypothetical protein
MQTSIREDEEELEKMSKQKEEKQADLNQFNENVREANVRKFIKIND